MRAGEITPIKNVTSGKWHCVVATDTDSPHKQRRPARQRADEWKEGEGT